MQMSCAVRVKVVTKSSHFYQNGPINHQETNGDGELFAD